MRMAAAKENSIADKEQIKGQIGNQRKTIEIANAIKAMSKSPGFILLDQWIKQNWDFSKMYDQYQKDDKQFDRLMKEHNAFRLMFDWIETKIKQGETAQKQLETLQKQTK